jgi:hypothetical protein
MAVKQFVIPLDHDSIQSGNITFAELVAEAEPVTFRLTNVEGDDTNGLNLITNKSGVQHNHPFDIVVADGVAAGEISASQMADVFSDADDDDWDYILAYWTVKAVDTPAVSVHSEIQGGKPYDMHGFPPKTKS